MNGDPIIHVLPNLCLFFPLPALTHSLWESIIKYDTSKVYDHDHVPIIPAEEYSMERLREATKNFKSPAVVRGLFSDTAAVKKWKDHSYLANSVLGDQIVPVVRGAVYDGGQNNRTTDTFANAVNEIVTNKDSKLYLFFPVRSRFALDQLDAERSERLRVSVNDLVQEDLQLDKKIWNGFGTKTHKTFIGSQMIFGRGTADNTTTGTGWHCAIGNNYFIQVVGKKRWYFMAQENSAMMHPIRGGMMNINTGSKETLKNIKHMPVTYADLQAGDMLYNPDWMWHSIRNYEGLSIGLPIRELNYSLSFRNNLHYSSIILINVLAMKLGIDIGGYPALISDADNF